MLPDFNAMYRDMAATLGTECRCEKCGGVVTVDPARCLRNGWPKCCGYTMTLLPAAPVSRESGKDGATDG